MPALSYSDVYLVPRYSELKSRSEADISVEFLGRKLAAPWLPANMSSVINPDIAKWLSENGYAYIYHRFGDTLEFVGRANRERWRLISISVGVKDADKDLLKNLAARGLRVDWICVDIAHGDSVLVKDMIGFIKSVRFESYMTDWADDSFAIRDGVAAPGRGYTSIPLAYTPKIIAGNVATYEGVRRLAEWGAAAIKVGIAGGGACSTKTQTGFHVPMFTCVRDVCYPEPRVETVESISGISYGKISMFMNKPTVPIIADGGIRENGDIAKALTAGATLVMAGSLFVACTDAPGEDVYPKGYWRQWLSGDCVTWNKMWEKGPLYKRYHGSASERQKGERKHVEGFEVDLPCNGLTVGQKYSELKESLQSAISYAGGRDLSAFKDVKWVSVK